MKIKDFEIGSEKVFLIAEIGINHNGSLEVAKNLILNSKLAGFDAVKFQKRTVEVVYTKEELATPRESVFGKTNGDLKRGLEFDLETFKKIDDYCNELGILWFASPWDLESVDFLESFNTPAFKIASACLTYRELIEKCVSTGKPIILSTGMSNMEQVEKAVKLCQLDNLLIMHAVSVYPASDEILNLSAIRTLQEKFPNIPIGYSGHEVGLLPSVVAVAKYGAVAVERHITLDRSMWGTDQSASLENNGMNKLVRDIRELNKLSGDGKKIIRDFEVATMKKLRKIESL